jgi:hypothetical protein
MMARGRHKRGRKGEEDNSSGRRSATTGSDFHVRRGGSNSGYKSGENIDLE